MLGYFLYIVVPRLLCMVFGSDIMHHSVCGEAHVVWYSASLLSITLYIHLYPLCDNIMFTNGVMEHWLGQVLGKCI